MLSLFQPKCDDTYDLASKVMFYFHPKVSNRAYMGGGCGHMGSGCGHIMSGCL